MGRIFFTGDLHFGHENVLAFDNRPFATVEEMDAELMERILQALALQKRSEQWTREDGRFVPHPATWINQRRWEDEMPEAAPTEGDEEGIDGI